MARQWVQQGLTLPAPASGVALIDTGASVTCIDDEAAKQLGLPVIDVVSIASASHSSTPQNVYPVALEILGGQVLIESVLAIGGPLKVQGLLALVGRDVLRFCTLHYNGLVGQFTLAL
jgi:predicted aspartyl protease